MWRLKLPVHDVTREQHATWQAKQRTLSDQIFFCSISVVAEFLLTVVLLSQLSAKKRFVPHCAHVVPMKTYFVSFPVVHLILLHALQASRFDSSFNALSDFVLFLAHVSPLLMFNKLTSSLSPTTDLLTALTSPASTFFLFFFSLLSFSLSQIHSTN